MTIGEVAFYIVIAISNFILAIEWAKHGLWEIGIQRPVNGRVIAGTFIGACTLVIGGIANRFAGFDPVNYYAIGLVVGIPFLWIFIHRHAFLAPGLYDFNRAKTRTNYWRLTSLHQGRILAEEGEKLRNSSLVQGTVKMFERSITAQQKGLKIRTATRQIDLSDKEIDYKGNINANCPVCGADMKVPVYIDGGTQGVCTMCESIVSARKIGNILYISAILLSPVTVVSDKNTQNIAVAYSELAVLYRMMNLFEKAEQSLEEALKIAGELLEKEPSNREYLGLQSLTIFRRAELNHAQGNTRKAIRDYQASLAIDNQLDDEEGIRTNERMLEELIKTN